MSLQKLLAEVRSHVDSESTLRSPTHFSSAAIANAEREFWTLAGIAMAVDVVLTLYGLHLGLAELNPIARAALDTAGAAGLCGLKLSAVLVGLVCLPTLPSQHRVIVPLALWLPSLCAVVINALVIGSLLW